VRPPSQEYFSSFGKIIDAVVMSDSSSKRSRGFGFVTFEKPESVVKATAERFHMLHGRWVDVKPAIPKELMLKDAAGETATAQAPTDTLAKLNLAEAARTPSPLPGMWPTYAVGEVVPYEYVPSGVPVHYGYAAYAAAPAEAASFAGYAPAAAPAPYAAAHPMVYIAPVAPAPPTYAAAAYAPTVASPGGYYSPVGSFYAQPTYYTY